LCCCARPFATAQGLVLLREAVRNSARPFPNERSVVLQPPGVHLSERFLHKGGHHGQSLPERPREGCLEIGRLTDWHSHCILLCYVGSV
jgi:hypothetical protein